MARRPSVGIPRASTLGTSAQIRIWGLRRPPHDAPSLSAMSYALDLAHLWRSGGFRRLTWVRVLSQAGDGAFQFGIATAFFFDPTHATTGLDIAFGFATLFAPFTVVGPFVGPLIDRWQRQRIVLVSNLVRVGLVALIATSMITSSPSFLKYVLALMTLSVNRFLLAALTSGIPRVVPNEDLLTANAIQPTLGTIAATLGGAVGGVFTVFAPGVSDHYRAVIALALAGGMFAASCLATTTLTRTALGPLDPRTHLDLSNEVTRLVRGLREGLVHLHQRVTPFHALGVMAAQRLLYGVMFVAAILIARHLLADPTDVEGGLAQLTLVVGFGAVGFGLAAALTPAFAPRLGPRRWILTCLMLGALGQIVLTISPTRPWLYSAAVIVSFAVQGGKIAVDTIVQRDTDDAFRGRAFTLYDVAYNIAFIGSAFVAAACLPTTGYSRVVEGALAVAYLVVAVIYASSPSRPAERACHH